MRVAVLGPVGLVGDDGRALPVGSPQQRHLLAVLAATPGRVVGVDVLVDALWADGAPPAAVTSLRAQVSRLRKLTGDVVRGGGDGYLLDLPPHDVDAARFEQVLARARRGGVPAAELAQALALWRGRAFAEFADSPPLRPHAARLDAAREELSVVLAQTLLTEGDPAAAVPVVRDVLAQNEFHEPAWVVLVEALTAQGRPVEAAEAYREAAAALAEAGFDPGPALRAAYQAALSADRGAPVAGPGPAAAQRPVQDRGRPRPPRPLIPLIGRDAERAALDVLLERARLVCLVGPGGVGKTLLAWYTAYDRAERHAGGARVAELGRLTDPQAVAPAIAAALGLAEDAAALDRAGAVDALLVLDNCEHLIEDVAGLVPRLLAGGARLRILATSREPIAVEGEHLLRVAPLPAGRDPSGADAAGRVLFLERARQVRPDLVLDPEQADRIVEALDGLPLALQMAAARLAVISPDELERELESGLERLRSVRRDVDRRHRSVRDVIGWSEALLPDGARQALAAFSVFSGPVTGAAALRVAGADDALVQDLVDRSLLVADTRSAPSRYRALAVVRAVGRDRLFASGRDAAVRRRHAEWVLDSLTTIDATLRTAGEAEGLAAYRELYDELRTAHRWAREAVPSLAVSLSHRGHLAAQALTRREPGRWALQLDEQLAGAGEAASDPIASGVLSCVLTSVLANAGRLEEAVERGRRALADLEPDGTAAAGSRATGTGPTGAGATGADHPAVLYAYDGLLDAALYSGDRAAGEAAAQGLTRAAERLGDTLYADIARVGAALCRGYAGHVDQALELVAAPPTGPAPSALAWLLYARGEVVLDHDPPAALESLDQAVAAARSVGHRYVEGVATLSVVSLRARAGDPDQAREAFAALLDHQLSGEVTHLETTLRNLVTLLRRLDRAPESARLLGTVTGPAATPTYGAEAARLAADEEALRAVLGHVAFEAAAALGRSDDVWAAAERARAVLG